MIDGYKVVTFNYFLCDYHHFERPLADEPNINAFNCRGITFVFNKDGSLYNRFFMLPKFFNLNQVESTQYNIVKDKPIKHITSKEDGSLIAFMNLPNGVVFAKTQAGFTNEQSVAAMKIYNENVRVKHYVDHFLSNGLTPLFEYVAFNNRIVLQYSKPELRFIGIVDNKSGEYDSVASQMLHQFDIPCVNVLKDVTLDELIENAKTLKDKEGWVIEFEDGQLMKVKVLWYLSLHHLRTQDLFREDFIIEKYLNETIDDVIGEIDPIDDKDAFDFIKNVENAVNNWSDHIEECVNMLMDLYLTSYDKNRSSFAREQNRAAFFGLAMNKIDVPEEYRTRKIKYMLQQSYRLQEARRIVEKWKNKIK
jgi:T4 RnlA family RNA ligase